MKGVMHLDFLTTETCCGSTHTREVCQTTRTLKETKFLFLLGSSVKAVLYSRTVNLLRVIYRYDLMQQTAKKNLCKINFDLDIEVIACPYSIKECGFFFFFTELSGARIRLAFTVKQTLSWHSLQHFERLLETGRSLEGSDLHCKQLSAQQI